MSDDERAIRDLVDRWLSASRDGDLPTVMELMADDVVFLVPGREPFGKAAFAAASAQIKDIAFDGTSDIQEIQVMGDWAYLRNHLTISITPPGQTEPIRRSGHTLTILRRQQDGRWVLVRDANFVA